MPDLTFEVQGAEAIPYAATPLLAFKLRITNANAAEAIHTIVLRAQIQIEATRRRYTPTEQRQLVELFGEPDRWSQTLRNMLWSHANTVVPSFQGETTADLPVPCTFDFNVGATKYFHGLSDGELPLIFLFSGTVFYEGLHGNLQVAPIPWDRESRFRLPIRIWRQVISTYYPNSTWLSLRKDVFERFYQFKVRNGIPTWEQALERLLAPVEETAKQ